MKIPNDWHKGFYKISFYNPADPAAVAHAPEETRFILREMKLKKSAAVLDLCCGPGRHSILLAAKGLKVTGYDFSRDYLKEAERSAAKAGTKIRFMQGDMRRLRFEGEFDAAINLFTSFGYFRKFSEDIRTLKGVARALKPGGLFLVDIIHGDYVRKHLRPQTWSKLEDGVYRLAENKLSGDGVATSWTLLKNGKETTKSFFVRCYSRGRLTAALREAGLTPVKFWGGFDGARLTADTDRLIALARKTG